MDNESFDQQQEGLGKIKQRVREGFYLRKEVVTAIAEKFLKEYLFKKVKP